MGLSLGASLGLKLSHSCPGHDAPVMVKTDGHGTITEVICAECGLPVPQEKTDDDHEVHQGAGLSRDAKH